MTAMTSIEIEAGPGPRAEPPSAALDGPPLRLWGCGPVELHDRLWASRGVQVIRCGSGATPAGDAAMYLLIGQGQLVRFPLGRALRRMHWLNPEVLRIRITGSGGDAAYGERIVDDGGDGLIGFERSYRRKTGLASRARLASSASVAARWSRCEGEREGAALMRGLSREGRTAPLATRGLAVEASDPAGVDAWLEATLGKATRIDAAFGDVFEHSPDVWVHAEADVAVDALLIGPVWVGSGARIPPGQMVVGPAVVEDGREPQRPLGEVDWEAMRATHWSLPPLRREDRGRRLAKRAFDLVFSLAAIAATLPIYPVVALLIMLEDGRPIFFAHRRQTLGGREFPCVKFRTMVKNADAMKASIMAANEADGPQFYIKDDPRMLRVGRVLRKLQIDELPQFFNVLWGHMSVVGPRPSPDRENQFCPTWREARLSVRPGVTGLWQVRRTRAAGTDFQEWIRYDLQYVRHHSLWRDVMIIFETVRQILSGALLRGEGKQ